MRKWERSEVASLRWGERAGRPDRWVPRLNPAESESVGRLEPCGAGGSTVTRKPLLVKGSLEGWKPRCWSRWQRLGESPALSPLSVSLKEGVAKALAPPGRGFGRGGKSFLLILPRSRFWFLCRSTFYFLRPCSRFPQERGGDSLRREKR